MEIFRTSMTGVGKFSEQIFLVEHLLIGAFVE